MIKINLNPRKKGAITQAGGKRRFGLELPHIKAPALKVKGIVFVAIPLVILGLEAFYYLQLDYSISKVKSEINAVNNSINKYKLLAKNIKELEKQIEEQKKIKESIRTQILVFQKFAIQKGQVLKMFQTVALSMPDGIWLTDLSIDRNTSSANLSGYSFNPKLITKFMNNLSEYYTNISFNSTRRIKGNIVDFYKFDLKLSNWKGEQKNNNNSELAQNTSN
jgi:Tfp pilus assembly protein PilN